MEELEAGGGGGGRTCYPLIGSCFYDFPFPSLLGIALSWGGVGSV